MRSGEDLIPLARAYCQTHEFPDRHGNSFLHLVATGSAVILGKEAADWRLTEQEWGTMTEVALSLTQAQTSNPHIARNQKGNTPLNMAVQSGNPHILDALLKPNANPMQAIFVANIDGNTPLHLAISIQDLNAIERLLQFEPEEQLNIKNREGATALACALDIDNASIHQLVAPFSISKRHCTSPQTTDPFLVAGVNLEEFVKFCLPVNISTGEQRVQEIVNEAAQANWRDLISNAAMYGISASDIPWNRVNTILDKILHPGASHSPVDSPPITHTKSALNHIPARAPHSEPLAWNATEDRAFEVEELYGVLTTAIKQNHLYGICKEMANPLFSQVLNAHPELITDLVPFVAEVRRQVSRKQNDASVSWNNQSTTNNNNNHNSNGATSGRETLLRQAIVNAAIAKEIPSANTFQPIEMQPLVTNNVASVEHQRVVHVAPASTPARQSIYAMLCSKEKKWRRPQHYAESLSVQLKDLQSRLSTDDPAEHKVITDGINRIKRPWAIQYQLMHSHMSSAINAAKKILDEYDNNFQDTLAAIRNIQQSKSPSEEDIETARSYIVSIRDAIDPIWLVWLTPLDAMLETFKQPTHKPNVSSVQKNIAAIFSEMEKDIADARQWLQHSNAKCAAIPVTLAPHLQAVSNLVCHLFETPEGSPTKAITSAQISLIPNLKSVERKLDKLISAMEALEKQTEVREIKSEYDEIFKKALKNAIKRITPAPDTTAISKEILAHPMITTLNASIVEKFGKLGILPEALNNFEKQAHAVKNYFSRRK